MKVFHITYWFPNKRDLNEAVWIRRHIEALAPYVEGQYIFHLQIGKADNFHFFQEKSHENHSSFILLAPIPWWLVEMISSLAMTFIVMFKARRYHMVNVHIAYPLLTYFHLLKRVIRKPVVISEHWSAYNFNFGTQRDLKRIKKIFSNGLPLITVSERLRRDIEKFSQCSIRRGSVIPNAVDAGTFGHVQGKRNTKVFFMLSAWKWPKRPEIVLQAFAKLIQNEDYSDYQLRIAGCQTQLSKVHALVTSLEVTESVVVLGNLSPLLVAQEMRSCGAFLHCTEYETFSVVCAEAICSGTPVIASAVGAIPELVNDMNGVLISENTVDNWVSALRDFEHREFDHVRISATACTNFSFDAVGRRYWEFIKVV